MIQERVSPSDYSNTGTGSHKRILVGIVVAIFVGTAIGGWFPGVAVKFRLLGELFLNALMMIVVPLVILSMIVGITGLGDIRKIGAIGRRTVIYYMVTTGLSVLIGIILVNLIRPGQGISPGEYHADFAYAIDREDNRMLTLIDTTWDKTSYTDKYVLVLKDQMVQGIIESVAEKTVTVHVWEPQYPEAVIYITSADGVRLPFYQVDGQLISAQPELELSGSGVEISLSMEQSLQGKVEQDIYKTIEEVLIGNKELRKEGLVPRNLFNAMVNTDILPLIFFALLIGAALSVLGKQARHTIKVISTLNDAVMRLVGWIMEVAPVGIFGLIATRLGDAGGFKGFLPELMALGKYSFTVLGGLTIHAFVILPLILLIFGRRHPLRYLKGVGAALLNAFSTASSSATLPMTLEGVEKENGVSNRTASFVLPLGATINMDGTALYEAVAAIFIAQVYGITMTPVEQVVIFLTATLAAIGAAGIPQAGLVTMVIVLNAVGLPIEGIGLILTIDWLLDRFRTAVNVWGDSVGAAVIEAYEMKPEKK
ncbi:MAG: dicarboxylate/amino acid:cation symporter [Marinilabiliaceae bacterium]|nr:dicarboxylate/amino acid:cation symporter [Marinilabiliaceae bacterium]